MSDAASLPALVIMLLPTYHAIPVRGMQDAACPSQRQLLPWGSSHTFSCVMGWLRRRSLLP